MTGKVERVVFLVAVAVISIHVLDDSFIQPEPGTSAGDHLVSGLVPFAALLIAVVAYPRVRDGWGAIIALLVGVFGIAAGIEGWHYTREVGASGNDYTGLVALPAGVVLVLLAAVKLWRSRRTDERLPRRYLRRALVGAAGLIVGIALVAPFMMAYGYTHLGRAVVPDPKLGGADYDDVKFETGDGLSLEGWYIPSKNGAAVIAFPGRSGTRESARFLARHGYGVLLFDRRGEGDSEGDPNSLGWGGTKGSRGGRRVPPRAVRRGSDRIGRHRPLGGRRDAAGVRSGVWTTSRRSCPRAPGSGSVRRGRRASGSRSGPPSRRGPPLRQARRSSRTRAAAEPQGPCQPQRTTAAVPDLRRSGPGRRGPLGRLLTRPQASRSSLEDRQQAHRRLRGRSAGVRAPGGALLRRLAPLGGLSLP